ncbi:DNA repair protein RadA [Liquorilactobacillus mali]|uniref:DNA repair protein RadA n=1 Tax=Liquorilactobacillus mali KCTC 3596 = DSM 20444 TaxID=1046596 RepID=J0KZM1_9LACO|nr:DNA repair protein RadA [Liquorilactobacillus mali]EJF00143.1 DNA repair protein RadA [Liquorilactobacillus mali KCTC 3596 = DSM 20444]KRN09898.1 DNA repair protein RadA [Liquorilactobacillus mali KCTC 3596 = DSM 20444]MDC7953307.1 DNA repair protein RadA [Liquorilactobacillus mali]MDV7756648.1 DNA repair protein RadA [Liquorilactobacillus mali]QFQ74142.1 DNA repair protein RadA [Liquorilactobacillus mali]
MVKIKTQFVCQDCGYSSPRYLGRCPNCGAWNTLVEEVEKSNKTDKKTRVSFSGNSPKPQLIDEVNVQDNPRTTTASVELDRVLGGGIVPGSLILIGGDPGIGKSTLLLQLSGQLARQELTVLYVSGEESAMQIKLRAQRLGVKGQQFYLYPETDMTSIHQYIDKLKPNFVVIDSVQTMQEPEMSSAVGSVAQIREVTAELMQIAKTNGITIFIVGHVTKGGAIAGPKILEHMVDTVLYFEGDLHHAYRILRAVKNRFGSTNEIGIFEMKEGGLYEVQNPSEIFLEERLSGATGSAIVVSLEGTRPILVEIQALVTPTAFGNAKRTTTGLDHNRISLIMAVLEKRAGLLLQNQDAYLKAAGGVKLDEPAIDLAIAVSIVSSYRDAQSQATDCFIGELGLTGEIRRVNRIEQRVAEAAKLGFKRVILPKNNLAGWTPPRNIKVVGVSTLSEALKVTFN